MCAFLRLLNLYNTFTLDVVVLDVVLVVVVVVVVVVVMKMVVVVQCTCFVAEFATIINQVLKGCSS